MKKRIAVFASGGGTDFQSIIDGVESGMINAEIVLLVASKQGIYSLERAKKRGIESRVFEKSAYPSLEEMYDEIIGVLKEKKTDMIVLAGYLSILTPNIIKAYPDRIINIHPALLPKFGGKGYYGLRVHKAVLEAGEKESGATVHYVNEIPDGGRIIAQSRVPVFEGDTPETLQARVLETEHRLLPETVAALCEDGEINAD